MRTLDIIAPPIVAGDKVLFSFKDFALDGERRELRARGTIVPIEPQVFDLLVYLIQNRDRVVSKDDLISAIWNGRIVSDAALTTRLNAARAAIGDDGDKQRLIKTLPRKGFRFVGAVKEEQRHITSSEQSGDTAHRPFSPPRLSIVVLPFANLSGDELPEGSWAPFMGVLLTSIGLVAVGAFLGVAHAVGGRRGRAASS